MENFSSTSIKILVPNSTAGMIIGKGGSYIKQIKEDSGAYVQISQKCTDLTLPERCVTIVGELDNIRKACAMILSKIVEDVGSAYRDIRASSITTPPVLAAPVAPLTTAATAAAAHPPPSNMFSTHLNNISPSSSSTSSPSPSSSTTTSDMNSAQIIESFKLVLRVSGYGEDAVSEITSAMSTLASYGVLGVGLGLL